MAYSDNLMAMDPSWMFRNNAFPDTWLPDNYFSRETETFAKALQKSFDETQCFENVNFSGEFIMSPLNNTSDTTATVSGGSAENENNSSAVAVVTSKQRRNGVAAAGGGGRITKRKSRASKRATTTFINADASNFRQLVQQITGVKIGGGDSGGGQVLKPEPQRAVNRLQLIGAGGEMPKLDTSAYLLNPTHQNNQHQVAVSVHPPSTVVVSDGGSASPPQFDYDSFCNFPTLESWKSF